MKDNRPVNLDFGTMRLPITAYTSITHRISGVILVVSAFLLLWALESSLQSADSFAALGEILGSPVAKFVAWGIATAMLYHSFAGVRHLIMDFGIGETLKGGVLGSRIVIVLSLISSAAVGISLW